MLDAAKLVKLAEEAPNFIGCYQDKQRLVETQCSLYDKSTDELERSILIRWIFNNQKWLEENQEKYYICQRLAAADLSSIQTLLTRINEIDTEIG